MTMQSKRRQYEEFLRLQSAKCRVRDECAQHKDQTAWSAQHINNNAIYWTRIWLVGWLVSNAAVDEVGKNTPLHRGSASRSRRRNENPFRWGYNWATLSLGGINTVTWTSRLGVGRKLPILLSKKCREIQGILNRMV
jgi:hypothetical protein